jgi:hypothetical protein
MEKRLKTPWGWSQEIQEIAPGIRAITTSSHGGYKLDPKMNAKVHVAWRTRGGWYEEDCEWAIVAYTFRDCPCFSAADVAQALHKLKSQYPDAYTFVTGETVRVEESYVLQRRAEEEAAKGKLQSYVAWGSWHNLVPKGQVGVCCKVDGREGTGPERYFLVPEKEYELRSSVFVVDPEKYEEVSQIWR